MGVKLPANVREFILRKAKFFVGQGWKKFKHDKEVVSFCSSGGGSASGFF